MRRSVCLEEERVGRKWGAGHGKKFEFYFKGTREP